MPGFLTLPPIDTSLGLFEGESVKKDEVSKPVMEEPPPIPERNRIPPIRTSFISTRTDNTQELFASTSEALADALGLSPNEVPHPTDHPRQASSIYLPPVDVFWKSPSDLSESSSVEKRLTVALTETLGLQTSEVFRDESFVELGGSLRTADILRSKCFNSGLFINTEDILRCKTIAELETYVTPISPAQTAGDSVAPLVVSPLQLSPPLSSFNTMRSPASQRKRSVNTPITPLNLNNRVPLQPKASRRYHSHVEQVLSLNPDVSKASVLKPRAGHFEGEVVAFLTLASCVFQGPNNCDIKLLGAYYTGKLPSIRKAVEEKVPPTAVPKHWIVLERMPLDESGKINRRKLQTWVQNANEELQRKIMSIDSEEVLILPSNDVERRLQKTVSKVLNIEQKNIGMNLSFTKLGGDGTTAMQLVVRCKSQGITLKPDDVLQAVSLIQLASMAKSKKPSLARLSDEASEEFDLSPMQRLYFHTSMGGKAAERSDHNGSYRFNQSMLLLFKKPTAVEDVRAAIEAVVGHHSMLRIRFRPRGASWRQYILSEVPSSYHFGQHTVGTNAEVEAVIRQAQTSIDIENGPVFEAHHFHTNDSHQMLYLVAHHLVTDIKSWKVIANDLDELLTNGNLISGRALTFRAWNSHQRRRVQQDMESSSTVPFKIQPSNWEYWGISGDSNVYGHTAASSFTLGPEFTALLQASNRAFRTDSSDIFMAALLLSFVQIFQDRPLPSLWNQEHDRTTLDPELDITENVGWFTSLCPLAVDISSTDDIFKAICQVKDARHNIVERGVPYFAANLMDGDAADVFTSKMCPLEILFTYAGAPQSIGRQDGLLEPLPIPGRTLTSKTSDIGPKVGRIALFEVSAALDRNGARFNFLYHRDSKCPEAIQSWIRSYETLLRDAITRLCYQPPALTMSDMPLVDLTYEGLTKLNRDVLSGLTMDVRNIENMYPVTGNQQNILVNESLIPGSSNLQTIYELNTQGKSIDMGRICAAWQQIAENHTALRTIFIESVSKNGIFDQIVLLKHSPNMLFIECDDDQNALAAIEKLAPMPLTKGAPWHRLIVCQSPGNTLLKLEVSQALCDGASVALLFDELEQIYFNHTHPPTAEVSYAEYLQCLKTTPCSTEFWRELLADAEPCHFPNLLSRQSAPREHQNLTIDLEYSHEKLEAFARKCKMDMAAVLRVAWCLVLRAYVGSDAVCFGYRTSGRDLPVHGLQDAVGSFSTVLICNLHGISKQFLTQLLQESEETHREALHHQHVSVNNIQHTLNTKGGRLFNTCLSFGFEDILEGTPSEGKLEYIKSVQGSEYDVNVDINFKNGNIMVNIAHRILTQEAATGLALSFKQAIECIIDRPESILKDIDLFSDYDHQQILDWNSQPQMAKPKQLTHHLIASRAIRYPDLPAVCAWDGKLSYVELDEMAMKLATFLRSFGVASGEPVPVIVDKSKWAIVAMLAVLNAGAVLVPVDAELPSMFSCIVKSVGATTVIASESVRKSLSGIDSDVLYINETTISHIMSTDVMDNPPQVNFSDTACILFKPGTSKNHKGITYNHDALATACVGQGPALKINPSSRVMQLSSYSLDIALSEIFTTLVHGGCVCVPSAAERVNDFTSAIQRMEVNWTYLTPALSRKLQPENLPNIAVVCFRTRHLDDDTCGPWMGKARILLAYGSAESCPLGLAASEVLDGGAVRCIGKPFCGNFWIVHPEDSNRLVPVGAVGELLIGSPTLANGYEIKESDPRQWFGKSPSRSSLSVDKSGRLLKTGHYVRYREDGLIELVAARGEKTSINGKQVKTADIERRLRRCLGRGVDVVVDKIAFNYRDSDSKPILAAFVELGEDLFDGSQDLTKLSSITKERLFLAKRMAELSLRDALPSHMIPSAFIPVKKMPVTPSLKVSRRELQKKITGLSKTQLLALSDVPNPHEVQAAGLNPLPLTHIELRIRAIWAGVLGVEESSITANDGFISLGGNNDLAHELVIACRERGISVSIVDVLRNLTLNEICGAISISETSMPCPRASGYQQTCPYSAFIEEAIVPQIGYDRDSIEDVAETSSLQTMFLESGLLSSRGNVNYFLINVTGALDWGKLENACFLLTAAHPILRTAFAASHSNRQLYQAVLSSYHADFQRFQCPSWRLGGLATKLVKRDAASPIDFRVPCTKFWFLDSGKTSIIVMRLSRAQYSDASLPVLMRDLGQLYEHGPGMPRSGGFCDVVRATQQAALSGAMDYWQTLLAGSHMTEVIAQSTPVPSSSNSRTISQQIPTGSIRSLGIPFETILKGAWSVVLANLSESEDVTFGHLVDNKHVTLANGCSASDIVGPMGNIIPVRTKIPDIPMTPYEFFRCVQSQHVASIPHENMPFTDIIQKCTTWPSWTRFSTVVQHQNQGERECLANFAIGNAACKLNCMESNHQNSDIFVRTVSASGSAHVDITMSFCEKRIQPMFAEEILRMLCSTISLLTSAFVIEPMALRGLNDSQTVSRIPLAVVPATPLDMQLTPVQSVLPDHASAIHTIISTAWDAILGAHALRVPDVRSVPFYDIWGSLIPAAELARYYNDSLARFSVPGMQLPEKEKRKEAVFTLEDVLGHPTMMAQYEMIIAKLQALSAYASVVPNRNSSIVHRVASKTTWGRSKNTRKLSVSTHGDNGTTSPSTMAHSSKKRMGHAPRLSAGSSGDSSMESMTTGSSQSDDDEDEGGKQLADVVSPLSPVGMHPIIHGAFGSARKRAVLLSIDTGRKRGSILGRMGLGTGRCGRL